MVKISTEDERCCGSGNCVLAAPAVFDQRESDGVVVVTDPSPDPSAYDAVRTAAVGCPTSAIRLEWT